MILADGFIQEYIRLQNERDAGENIWRLCFLSAKVVSPRGVATDGTTRYYCDTVSQEEGASRELAEKARCEVDTIERRAFAWRAWERFLGITTLLDGDDNEIEYTWYEIRSRLFYNNFSEVGRKCESGKITPEQSAVYLVEAVRQNWSVNQLGSEIKKFTDDTADFMREWEQFRKKSRNLRRWPHITGRPLRLLKELESFDLTPPS